MKIYKYMYIIEISIQQTKQSQLTTIIHVFVNSVLYYMFFWFRLTKRCLKTTDSSVPMPTIPSIGKSGS